MMLKSMTSHWRVVPHTMTALLLSGMAPGAGAAPVRADTVYLGGRIHTLDGQDRQVEAVAIRAGKFVAVGDERQVRRLIGPKTRVVALQGAPVLPGLIDAHGHYVRGALRRLFYCDFPASTAVDDIAPKVKACVQKGEPGAWIVGGAWASAYVATGKIHRTQLDAVAPDNPVFLLDDTGHNGYVNSRALQMLGFTREHAANSPAIVKDPSGEPNGQLLEEAAGEATRKIPPLAPEKYQAAVRWSVQEANRYGITAYVEARTDRPTLAAYGAVDRAGQLSANVATFLQYDTDFNESQTVQEETVRQRAQYRSPHVHNDFVKLYLDGVPPAYTGALLEPYEPDAHDHAPSRPADFRGQLRMDPARIQRDLVEFDRMGLTVKMHAAGDASVRAALDAVDAARRANGVGQGLPHSIAHVGLVAPSDLPRFRTLGVVADIAPPLWIPGSYSKAMVAAIGQDRYDRTCPTGDLERAGAVVAYGSDWPSISASINPWPHLQSLVDRAIGPAQRIDLRQAVATMTRGAAQSIRLADRIGSIEVGKSADLVVLDRDPLRIPTAELGGTQVQLTVFEGREVYRAPAPEPK